VHGFDIVIEIGILVDIVPGKSAVIQRRPEIPKIFQPVPVDSTSIDRFVKPVDVHCGRRQRQSSQNLREILARNEHAGLVLVHRLA